MKRSFYGPYFRFLLNKIDGKKILGKADKDETERICKKVAHTIAKVDSKRTEEEIFQELKNKIKIVYTEQLPAFSGAKGSALGNTIFVDYLGVNKTLNDSDEELIDNEDFNVIVHECIHKLQKAKLFYERKYVVGFVEGATELMTLRANAKNRSTNAQDVSINFPSTPYIKLVSMMAQFEIMYGKDVVEDYALRQDQTLLKKIKDTLGYQEFDIFRRDMNAEARKKEQLDGIEYWQDCLLQKCFDKDFSMVQSKEDAENYLNRLKELEKVRIRIKGDDTFKNYYESKFQELCEIYPDLDREQYEYKPAEVYPELYFNEEIKRLDEKLLWDMPSTYYQFEEFQKLNLDDYKRYRFMMDDKVFETVTFNGKPISFRTIDENNKFADFSKKSEGDNEWNLSSCNTEAWGVNSVITNEREGEEFTQFRDLMSQAFSVTCTDGKVHISMQPPLTDVVIENQEMEEVPLNITKRDIYNEIIKSERLSRVGETWIERIKRFFKKTKALPPYSEAVKEEPVRNFREAYKVTSDQLETGEHQKSNDNLRQSPEPSREDNEGHDEI